MHYRNGREAKNGDMIVSLGYDGAKIVVVWKAIEIIIWLFKHININISPV